MINYIWAEASWAGKLMDERDSLFESDKSWTNFGVLRLNVVFPEKNKVFKCFSILSYSITGIDDHITMSTRSLIVRLSL